MLLFLTVYELRKGVDRFTIKNFCGIFYGLLMLALGFFFLPMVFRSLGDDYSKLSTFASLFLAIAGLLPVYVAHAKALMHEANIEPKRGELFGRYVLGLLAFLLFICLVNVAELLGFLGSQVALGEFGELVTLLTLLVVPLVFYRLSVRCLLSTMAKPG